MVVLCSLVHPYKHRIANVSAVTALILISALFTLATGLKTPLGNDAIRVMILIILTIPHCAFGGYLVWKIKKMITTCHCRYRNTEEGERERLLYSPTANNSALHG